MSKGIEAKAIEAKAAAGQGKGAGWLPVKA
jgi:hypothetical protein